MRRSILTLALAAAAPAIVTAQSMPPGFYGYGYTAIEHYEFDGNDANMGYADISLGFRPSGNAGSEMSGSGSGSMPGFGFQLDFLGLWILDEDYDETSIMPWVYYQNTYGRFSLGYTPILVSDYVDHPVLVPGAALNYLEFGLLNRSYLEMTRHRDGDDYLSVRYDHKIGALGFGASLTEVEDTDGVQVVALGVSYTAGDLKIGLGYEEAIDEDLRYFGASARYDMGALTITGNVTKHDGFVFDGITSFGLGADYRFNDRLSLGASYTIATQDSGGSDDLSVASIYGEYDIWNGIVLGAGYSSFDSNDIYVASIGYRFDFGR